MKAPPGVGLITGMDNGKKRGNEPSTRSPSPLCRYFPFGIVFLVAGKILDMQDPAQLGEKLGMYFITVLCGLLVHGLILLPLFYFFFTRKNPFPFIRGLLQALVIALATSSR